MSPITRLCKEPSHPARWLVGVVLVLLIPCHSTAALTATQITCPALADSMVMEGYPNTNYGAEWDMWTGYDTDLDPDGKTVRSLIQFDLSEVPAGSHVTGATLRLYLSDAYEFPGELDTVTVYAAAGGWSETAVTWSNSPSLGDAYGSAEVGTDLWGEYDFDVTALVQAWIDGSLANHGLVLRGEEDPDPDTSSWRGFSTREFLGMGPQLIVEYTPAAVERRSWLPLVQ